MENGIRDDIPDLIFENLVSVFLGYKYLNSFMTIRIRDLVSPGSRMEKIGSGILDKHPGSATLIKCYNENPSASNSEPDH